MGGGGARGSGHSAARAEWGASQKIVRFFKRSPPRLLPIPVMCSHRHALPFDASVTQGSPGDAAARSHGKNWGQIKAREVTKKREGASFAARRRRQMKKGRAELGGGCFLAGARGSPLFFCRCLQKKRDRTARQARPCLPPLFCVFGGPPPQTRSQPQRRRYKRSLLNKGTPCFGGACVARRSTAAATAGAVAAV